MKTQSAKIVIALALVGLITPVFAAPSPETSKKIRVLLVTGDDILPYHDWREVSQAVKDTLLASGRFDVRVSEDSGILDSAATLSRYDLIFLQMFNAKTPTISDTAKANLTAFVKGGKGLALAHLSSASFKEWAEFPKLVGRVWVMGKSGHNPRSVFHAHVVDKEHPITRGLADFDADDELYAKLQGDTPIHVLVSADSDWSHQTEPLAFTIEYGQGRVFQETFGHDGKAMKNESVVKLTQRGCEWAATGKVADER